ncbi:hypothetical protein VNO77_08395 [Canavalia gladiata]|uniref:Uncharacterized protein n=1 Tax=Canavalia gladiata TaxID=3824 RepID=A0AAN9M976_CANGL
MASRRVHGLTVNKWPGNQAEVAESSPVSCPNHVPRASLFTVRALHSCSTIAGEDESQGGNSGEACLTPSRPTSGRRRRCRRGDR